MRCGICDVGAMTEQEPYYVCDSCGHWLRKAPVDLASWHAVHYRRDQRYDAKEVADDGTILPTFHAARHAICLGRMECLAPYLPEIRTAFDIGCGAGTFLAMLKSRGVEVAGIEVHQALVDACAEQGIACTLGDFMSWTPPRKYDAVFAWHVLEHVREAYEFLVKALSMSTGYVFVEIPVNRGRDLKFCGHVHRFRRKDFDTLLRRLGCRVIEVRSGVQTPSLFAVLGAARA